jgi:hypothetical protein
MDDDLRFYGATGWDSVPSQRSAARLSKDTAKDGVGRAEAAVDGKQMCVDRRSLFSGGASAPNVWTGSPPQYAERNCMGENYLPKKAEENIPGV